MSLISRLYLYFSQVRFATCVSCHFASIDIHYLDFIMTGLNYTSIWVNPAMLH